MALITVLGNRTGRPGMLISGYGSIGMLWWVWKANLSWHEPMVAPNAVWGLAEPAARLNEWSILCNSYYLDEGLLNRSLGRYKDGVHRIVGHPPSDEFIIKHHLNVLLIQFFFGPNSTEHQEMWTSYCTRWQYHFTLTPGQKCSVQLSILVLENNSDRLWCLSCTHVVC